MGATKSKYRVYATVEHNGDVRDLGVFDTWTGGDGDSEETYYTEGGGTQVPLGGRPTRTNIVIARLFRVDRDAPLYPWLDSVRGKAQATFKKQPLDDDDNPVGDPMIRIGKLKRVSDPESDSNSNDASTFELEMSPNATGA